MNSTENSSLPPSGDPPEPASANTKKLIWLVAGIGFVVTIVTVMVAWWLGQHQRPPPVVGEALVLSRLTSAESKGWGPEVPHGTQVLNNVMFFCDGALRTAGWRAKSHPGAVLGIPIQRKATKIHLLHAAENAWRIPVGSVYGRLRFHFANGESRDFYLRFGIHGRDWFQVERELAETATDPNTEVGWLAKNERRNVWVRLFHTTLANPFPHDEITTMDAISPLGDSGANLLLFGVSTDTTPGALRPPLDDGWPPEKLTLAFSLQNSNGTPVEGGTVRWQAALDRAVSNNVVNRTVINFPPFPCDAAGGMSIEFPTHAITEIRYTANDQSGLTLTGIVPKPTPDWSPTQRIAVVFPKN
jgi:hypothetical protein